MGPANIDWILSMCQALYWAHWILTINLKLWLLVWLQPCVFSHDAKSLCKVSGWKEANGLKDLGMVEQLEFLL